MRRAMLMAAMVAMASALMAAPALADFGALARDEATGKYGFSWDKRSQDDADQVAMKDCAETSCKIIFRTRARQCGAIATAVNGNAWGAAYRGRKDGAELAAMNDCQKRTSGQCKVRASGCNR